MRKKKDVLILVESSGAYGRKITQGISLYVREHENWILHVEDRELYSVPMPLFEGWDGDGIIARTPGFLMKSAIERLRCPVVELLNVNGEQPIEVLPDDRKTIELCIEHFVERGVVSIAFYGYGQCWWVEKRRELFEDLAGNRSFHSHCFVDNSVRKNEPQPQWQEKYALPLQRWLENLPHKTGIVAASDAQAVRVLNICRRMNLKVPEQIGVLGIDNDEHLCNLLTPHLSSLDRNAEMVGYKAAELLDVKMNHAKLPPLPIVVPPRGVAVRRSSEILAIDDPDLVEALRFIAEFASSGIGVDEIANHIGLSKSTLCRLFQKALKRTPKEEIMRVRLDRAKYLLTYTDMSIGAVAGQTGYKTAEHFNTMFKQHNGVTPLTFRNDSRKFAFSPRNS